MDHVHHSQRQRDRSFCNQLPAGALVPGDWRPDGAVTLCGIPVTGGVSDEGLAVGIVIATHRVADEEGHGGGVDGVNDVSDLDHD